MSNSTVGAAVLAFMCSPSAAAQTKIDLSTQTRNVDFSTAASTRPARTGTVLPATCAVGELFFFVSAPPGSNLYTCSATNIWSAPSGSGGAGGVMASAFPVTPTATQMLIGAGSFRIGTNVFDLPAGGTINASGTSSGIVRVYAISTGQVVLGHSMGAGVLSTSSFGYLIDAASSGYPAGTIPLFECQMTAGRFTGACTDRRAVLTSDVVKAGSSGLLSITCPPGTSCVADLVTSLVPNKAGSNLFTGFNSFRQLQLPIVTALVSTDCDDPAEAGRIVYLSTGATGQRLYACEGTNGWVLQGR